jgi:iron complex outermembrane receptor protein
VPSIRNSGQYLVSRYFPALLAVSFSAGLTTEGSAQTEQELNREGALEKMIVTARLRQEDAQTVPVSLSVVNGDTIEATFTNNTQQIAQLVPALNYVSPNPRNTAFTIRGLGSSVVAVSQANDGLEPGVGFYVDQVYHARPATAAFDYVDLDRVEVLRGPQGTLFGKNTTAGAISISSRAPSFEPQFDFEASGASEHYWQTKFAVNGPLIDGVLAGRLSGAIAERDGVLRNVVTGDDLNEVRTDNMRGQLLLTPNDGLRLRLTADHSSFNTICCTQVYFGVAPTLKTAARQYPALAAGQGYAPPSLDSFDRLTDIDGPLLVDTSEGGVSTILDWDIGELTLTSISAWRYWDWDAENDRDYIGLPIQLSQHIPSRQDQYSQELRVASTGNRTVDWIGGFYWFQQTIRGRPITIYGPLATYWLLGPPSAFPSNLLDGYGTDGSTRFESNSYAGFGELTWHATDKLAVTAGLRYTWEDKDGSFESTVSGGLDTTGNAVFTNAKLSILRPQSYTAEVSDDSGSGRVIASYGFNRQALGYASYARGYKSGGINMSGLPLNAANQPALATAVVDPEKNSTYELGVKTTLLDDRLTFNVNFYDTTVNDYQANVVDTGPGALRGYLANIDEVHVEGAELDSSFAVGEHFTAHVSAAYADGKYVSYVNGPCPIEAIGNITTVCDLSGKPLPALPRRSASVGGEYAHDLRLGSVNGEAYARVEVTTRSDTFGDPSDSQYTIIDGYTLVNASIGLRRAGPWEVSIWARNLTDEDFMQNLTVQAGNSGLIVGTPSDPRSIGVTLRAAF